MRRRAWGAGLSTPAAPVARLSPLAIIATTARGGTRSPVLGARGGWTLTTSGGALQHPAMLGAAGRRAMGCGECTVAQRHTRDEESERMSVSESAFSFGSLKFTTCRT